MICRGKRAPSADALRILPVETANRVLLLHLDPEVLLHKADCLPDGQKRVPLAAARAADRPDLRKRARRHLMRQGKRLDRERRGAGNDRDEHPRADSGSAGAPEAAGAAGNAFPPVHHLGQRSAQVDLSPRAFEGRQQRRADHHVMLRSVHMAKRHLHHFFDDGNRIFRGLRHAESDDRVHSLRVTLVAHIMAPDAPRLAVFLLMADGTLHQNVRLEIFQAVLANQAFFSHFCFLRSSCPVSAASTHRFSAGIEKQR